MSNPEFSVILPVHNGSNYISEALSSVLEQDYDCFEVLILENVSSDGTVEIVQSFQDPRVRILPTNRLLSIEENWGRIAAIETRDYITFMGHDDILYPGFLTNMAQTIVDEPEASLYQSRIMIINDNTLPLRFMRLQEGRYSSDDYLDAVINGREEVCGTGYVMRAQDYRQVGGIPLLPGLLYADVILWYRLAEISHKTNVFSAKVGYRVHSSSTHHHYLDLRRYYSATRDYYDFLLNTRLLNEQVLVAHSYINTMIQHTYRNAASQLAFHGGSEEVRKFSTSKEEIIADGIFHLTDPRARLYEFVARLPNPLRRLALAPVRWRREYLQKRTKRR